MHFVVITGTSHGLGEAIADEFFGPDVSVYCISRNVNKALMDRAVAKGSRCHYISQDLAETGAIEGIMDEIFTNIKAKKPHRITLVNNAGTVEPVGPLHTNKPDAMTAAFLLNVVAPMTLSSHFIKMSMGIAVPKVIVNISSGAAQRPVWGWSTYCSTKAAIDMFTRVTALEQEDRENPVKVLAFAPGIVDTPMQEKIRNTSHEEFRDRDTFISYKQEGQLLDPSAVAKRLREIILDESVKNGSILHI